MFVEVKLQNLSHFKADRLCHQQRAFKALNIKMKGDPLRSPFINSQFWIYLMNPKMVVEKTC